MNPSFDILTDDRVKIIISKVAGLAFYIPGFVLKMIPKTGPKMTSVAINTMKDVHLTIASRFYLCKRSLNESLSSLFLRRIISKTK